MKHQVSGLINQGSRFSVFINLSLLNAFSTDTFNQMRAIWRGLSNILNLRYCFLIPCDSHGFQLLIKDLGHRSSHTPFSSLHTPFWCLDTPFWCSDTPRRLGPKEPLSHAANHFEPTSERRNVEKKPLDWLLRLSLKNSDRAKRTESTSKIDFTTETSPHMHHAIWHPTCTTSSTSTFAPSLNSPICAIHLLESTLPSR